MPKSRLEQNLNNLRNSLDVPQPIVVGEEAATESKAEVDQIQRIVQNTVSQQKPDIDWLAIASSLQQEIENTLNQINLIQKELSSARERVSESREALSLLQTPVKWMPVEGQFQLFDELQKVVDEQKDEQQRLEKLKQIEMAIASGDKLITQKEKQLALLQRELAELQESEEWCRTYAPHLRRFESAYRHSQDQEDLIRRYKRYLEDSEKLLKAAQEAQTKGQDFAAQWARGTVHGSIENAIAAYESTVEKNRRQLEDASRRDEKRFRGFVKARVDVDVSLQEFLKTQQQYQEASTVFFSILEERWEPLGLSQDDVLRLANLKLPQVKDNDGQITVI